MKIGEYWYIIFSLKMPFCGAPCPSEFALTADPLADTINDEDNTWNDQETFSHMAPEIPDHIPLSDDIPYA